MDIQNKSGVKTKAPMLGFDTILVKTSSFPNPTYKPNPKMAPRLILPPDDEKSNTAEEKPTESSNIHMHGNNYNYDTKSLDHTPNEYEKYGEDELLGMFSGNDNEEVNTPHEHLVNETNNNGM